MSNTHLASDPSLKCVAAVGFICAIACGLFTDFGMYGTATAFGFLTFCCFVYCGAEWELTS